MNSSADNLLDDSRKFCSDQKLYFDCLTTSLTLESN